MYCCASRANLPKLDTRLLGNEPEQELGELGAVRRQQSPVQGAQQRRPGGPQLPGADALPQVLEGQLHQRVQRVRQLRQL